MSRTRRAPLPKGRRRPHRCSRGTCNYCDRNAVFAQYRADVATIQDLRAGLAEEIYRADFVDLTKETM